MLKKEDNELLCRVGPGTAMGALLRQYWHPFLFPYELERDGPPLRIRLLGEDLIAFRDSVGQVGLIEANCPHRGASLFFGRNEECGLRCVYHGWKFDVHGTCVDMPSEPAESNFKHKVRATAYPCVERGGIYWAYMGPLDPPPPLPDLEFTRARDDQRFQWKRVQTSNWVQAMEGDIDQSHNSFLHTFLNPGVDTTFRSRITQIRAADKSPQFETVETNYGVCVAARRAAEDDTYYYRITQFLMPYHTMTGPYGENPSRGWRAWVPIDDENTLVIGATFHPLDKLPDRAMRPTTKDGYRIRGSVYYVEPEDRAPATSAPFGAWYPIDSLENDLRIDRHIQKTLTFSGIPVFWAQDGGTQLSMGKIVDRTKEHLGTTDRGIISTRRRLLNAARALHDQGTIPSEVEHPDWYDIRAAAVELPRTVDWFEATEEFRRVIPGVNQAGA
jgi:nitrite reductase/ring-hydroxylating ferredoxin subunit